MRSQRFYIGIIGISSLFLILASSEFVPEDNFLIDCGSRENTSSNGRVFLADSYSLSLLSSSQNISVNITSNSVPSTSYDAVLYQTARVFVEISQYNFPIKKKGRHWIRLHFFPFSTEKFNLSTARFSVSAQNFTLLKDFQSSSDPLVKEYSINITTSNLILKFTPLNDSFAFLNALEVVSSPDELIPVAISTVGSKNEYQNLEGLALETTGRINMGNRAVSPQDDTLGRNWSPDGAHLTNRNLVVFVWDVELVNYNLTGGEVDASIAPSSVFGSGTKLQSASDPNTKINATWLFNIDPGFGYFIRYHFCNIIPSATKNFFFNVFLNSGFVVKDLNLSVVGAPYYMDVFVKSYVNKQLTISVGTSGLLSGYPDALLNGLEIMKISNSKGSLDPADTEIQPSTATSNFKVWMIVVLAVGVTFAVLLFALVAVLLFRRRRQDHMVHSTPEHLSGDSVLDDKYSTESAIISRSKIGYRFPFAAVQEATDSFNEGQVIGIGGFGKVYKGVLKDDTKVAVKRGVPQSNQGLAEFRTEIEMLTQFRHRHLVSLIGYCDERGEMIVIYEYMENGTLKSHLYGSDLPRLNWLKRLEICIGSARGLHYLHTGSDKGIIHRDVKSANILLDEKLMAKVGDFGISKMGPEIDQTHVSTAVKGSFGYLDPEYLTTQQLTEKSDVYSFGVVMFEVLSGRPVIDPSQPREAINLVEWAIECSRTGEVEKIVDVHIADEIWPESLIKFKDTAEKCLAERGVDRPTMGDVLWNLEYALQLQLQVNDQLSGNNEPEASNSEATLSVTNTRFSLGDLADVSMNKVFSELVRAGAQ